MGKNGKGAEKTRATKQHDATAALGDAQSSATGQAYEQVDEVPLSATAIEQAEAIEDASEASKE